MGGEILWEIFGSDLDHIVGPRTDRLLFTSCIAYTTTSGSVSHGVTSFYRKDGSDILCSFHIYPIFDGNDNSSLASSSNNNYNSNSNSNNNNNHSIVGSPKSTPDRSIRSNSRMSASDRHHGLGFSPSRDMKSKGINQVIANSNINSIGRRVAYIVIMFSAINNYDEN